jgi:hypothetical protein
MADAQVKPNVGKKHAYLHYLWRDCPVFCVSKNGIVPFATHYAIFVIIDTKILTVVGYALA